MPETVMHWLVLVLGISLGQFILKYLATWLASLNVPFAHQLGTSFEAIIP